MVQQKKKKKAVLGESKRGEEEVEAEAEGEKESVPFHSDLQNIGSCPLDAPRSFDWKSLNISTISNQDPGKSLQIVDSDTEGGTGQIAWPCVCACDVYDVIMLITRTGRRGSVKLIHILAPRFECCGLVQSVDLLDVFLKAVYCVH